MTKQSLLTDLHRSRHATFFEQDGWLLADHFGDPRNEYQSVRTAAGLYDFSHRALLQFTGPDRAAFLQGMLSNDVRSLKMFEGQQAALLTQQGKVIADVRALCAMNSIYLDFWERLKEKVLAHLNRYLIADEVEINDPNNDWTILSLQGPRAPSIVDTVFSHAELPRLPNHHAMVQFEGAPICAVRSDYTGESGFDLIVQNSLLPAFARRLEQEGVAWVGERVQNVLRVEAGLPRYGVDFDEEHLLLEVGLDNAYSYTKGCYLGQEVVERIRSRGHVNKKLCGLVLDGDIPANSGDAIIAGVKEIGRITSSVFSFTLNQAIALGYVHKDYWAPGTKLSVRQRRASSAATVASLPFLPPGGAST